MIEIVNGSLMRVEPSGAWNQCGERGAEGESHFGSRKICTFGQVTDTLPRVRFWSDFLTSVRAADCLFSVMAENSPLYRQVGRKTPAKGVRFSFQGPNILWTTLCTKDRREWLAQKTVVSLLHDIWLTEATTWLVGDYLIMPDHVHFFCAPRDLRFSVERWFAFWKDRFTKGHQNNDWLWQRGGFHHRIRSGKEFTEKWNYMMENPIRKGLTHGVED